MAKKENKLIEEADEDYNVLTGDAEKKRLEWIKMVPAMEEHSALLTAKNEGIAEGEKSKQKEIAKKLLLRGESIEDIIELTGLTKAEIEQLKWSHKKSW